MKKKVSDYIAEFLEEQGIKHVFGIIGAGNAQIFDAIMRKGFTEIVCMHHEQAAVMAATTYYRINGKVTCALLTTGAGSTNGVTGVVSAWMDSMPVVVISGNENSKFTDSSNPLRIWGVQGYDSVKMVEDVTKWSSRLIEPEHVSAAIKYAYDIASSQRKGPVWLDIPMNIQASAISIDDLVDYNYGTTKIGEPQGPEKPILSKMEGVPSILSLLERAERPVLWLGHGVRLSGAESKVLELVDELGIPVLVSWQACDILDSEHELCFGRAGVYGQRAANFVLQNCDALICIGTRLAIPQVGYDLTEFARAAEIALVDVDIDELLKHGERIQLPICSDAGEFIDEIMKMITNKFQREKWLEQCNKYRNNFPLIGQEHSDLTDEDGITYINSYRFMKVLESYFHERQIVVTDMGTALLSGHQVLNFKSGQRMLTSTGLGEMGFGLPGAIGAAIASNRDVLCLNCDGGMMLNLQELQTIVHHNLPIKIIIFNNDGYLMIKHTQKALFDGRYIATDAKSGVTCPNYTKVAHAFDMPSFQIRTWDDAEEVLPKLQELQGPAICEVFTHPEQLFVPKLSLAQKEDGTIVSPPLEDLSPLLSRDDLSENMLIGMHQKSIDLS